MATNKDFKVSQGNIVGNGFRAAQGTPTNADLSLNGYAFGGDGDTGMFSPGSGGSNGVLAFFTNNTERVRLAANGQLGIGTSSPAYPLHVEGATVDDVLRVNATNNPSISIARGGVRQMYLQATASGAALNVETAVPFGIFTNNLERMRIDATGNIGVGTSNPLAAVELNSANVAGDDNRGNLYVRTSTAYAADVGGKITLGGFYNGAAHFPFAGVSGRKANATASDVSGYLQFLTTTSAGALTERMRIDASGNVGVGTASPAARLHMLVADGARVDIAKFEQTGQGSLTVQGQWGNADLGTNAGTLLYSAGPSYNIGFRNGTSGAASLVLNNGNVAIAHFENGLQAPARLSVQEHATGFAGIGVRSTRAGTSGSAQRAYTTTIIQASGANYSYDGSVAIKFHHNDFHNLSGDLSFWTKNESNTQSERMRITAAGYVGIGTASPGYALDVNGNGRFSSFLFLGRNDNSNEGGQLDFAEPNNNSTAWSLDVYGGTNPAFRILETVSSVTSERVRIVAGGKMAIGATTTYSELTVNNGSASGSLSLSPVSGGGGVSYILMGNANGGGATGPTMIASANRTLQFGVGTSFTSRDGGTFTEFMRIDSGGNVGIGISVPSARLHVAGASEAIRMQHDNAYISGYNSANTVRNGYLQFSGAGTTLAADAGGSANLVFSTNSANRLIIEVGGAVRPGATQAQTLGSATYRWSTIYSDQALNVSSDERLKADVQDLTEAETRVAKRLKGLVKTYRLLARPDKKRIGVIAQEVVAAFEAEGLDALDYEVVSMGEDGMYAVCYEPLTLFIVSAM